MSALRKLKPQPRDEVFQAKVFHATMLVTRLEEWWIEADSAEEAQALLASGQGHHATLGERVHVQVEQLVDGGDGD